MGIGGISLADAFRAKPSVSAQDWKGRVRDLAQFSPAIDSTWPGPRTGWFWDKADTNWQAKPVDSVEKTWSAGEGLYHGVVEGLDLPAAVLRARSSRS